MGLASHAIALGIGYVLGHPAGREQARKLPEQARQLAARPEAARLAEKGKAVAGQAAQTARQRLGRSADSGSSDSASATGGGTSTTGDTGRIATEGGARGRRRLFLFVRPRRRPGGIDAPTTAEPGVVVAETSGDPATDARSVKVTDPAVAERTEAAMHGTLPPSGKPRS
ncbi:hypothetical protein [Pseudonocardia humida]|uniref:YtxH-like protein n=1 Tax=Pseudonocardia humida TaxID=2800819 RepID=A0ABT0ZYB3_9PSEU|nr:hypothetical protein [Pseudonocardia humida]MCO1655749.1 hypothetical protein [Pseudonocardia humida]